MWSLPTFRVGLRFLPWLGADAGYTPFPGAGVFDTAVFDTDVFG